MTITIDDLVKLILVLSIAFSLVGLSVQMMRILGGLVDTVKESNFILHLVSEVMEKFTGDYDYIIEQVKSILESVSGFTRGVFVPLTKLMGFVKNIPGMGFMGKSSKESND